MRDCINVVYFHTTICHRLFLYPGSYSWRSISYIYLVSPSARTVSSRKRTSSACSVPSTLLLSYLVSARESSSTVPSADDVAEDRPGHGIKLYQYCSGDVDELIRRQLEVFFHRFTQLSAHGRSSKANETLRRPLPSMAHPTRARLRPMMTTTTTARVRTRTCPASRS